MKISVNFVIEVPEESVAALIDLAAAADGTRRSAVWFVRHEAEDYVIDYLNSNGVNDAVCVNRQFKVV